MTDFADACFGCGGHLRENAYSGTLCPICEKRHKAGETNAFGVPYTRVRFDRDPETGNDRVAA